MEGHTLTPPKGWKGPKEMKASGSAPSHSPSQSLVRRLTPDCPETWYCLGIQVISSEEGGATPPPHMSGRCQWWKTCSEMANLASQKQVWWAQAGPSYFMEGDLWEKDLA